MSAMAQSTSLDQSGGCGEEVTEDHEGSPDRLCKVKERISQVESDDGENVLA